MEVPSFSLDALFAAIRRYLDLFDADAAKKPGLQTLIDALDALVMEYRKAPDIGHDADGAVVSRRDYPAFRTQAAAIFPSLGLYRDRGGGQPR